MSADTEVTRTIKQVGGSHYGSPLGLQHWDLCVRADLHYLLSAASKYVSRHRLKCGREDLEKAVSYLERYARARSDCEARNNQERRVAVDLFLHWAGDQRLDARDVVILHAIMCTGQHHVAVEKLREMIEAEYPVNLVYDDAVLRPQDEKYMPGHPDDTAAAVARLANLGRPGTPEDGGHHERISISLPRIITQFWYDHRLDPGLRYHYFFVPSACRWVFREGAGVKGYELVEASEEA